MEKANFIEVKHNLEEVIEISKRATERLSNEFNIKVVPPEAIPTLAYCFLQQMCAYVAENYKDNPEVNFLQLFDFGVSTEEDEDGKNVPIAYITPGQDFKLKIKSDDETEEEEEDDEE